MMRGGFLSDKVEVIVLIASDWSVSALVVSIVTALALTAFLLLIPRAV